MRAPQSQRFQWLRSGNEVFPAMSAAIAAAQHTIRLETYIYAGDALGQQFRDLLVQARQRGVRVSILLDSFGSQSLSSSFWAPLIEAGGIVRWFNPVLFKRFGFRDHRKILVCDELTAFVGGFNIAMEYLGDGVESGWCDLGLRVTGPLVAPLGAAFDAMFASADIEHKPFPRLRRSSAKRAVATGAGQLLLSGPGRGRNPFARYLHKDLARAKNVRIIAAYFLPTWRIRQDLARVVRRGGRVQLVLAGKSDVYVSQLAGQSLYRRLLRAGIEIYEYQPQILHAKLLLVDGLVFVGSSNLDARSLHINYELMIRFSNRELGAGATAYFEQCLSHSVQIELEAWRRSRTWWRRFKQRWAYFLLARLDPWLARWQYKQSAD